jgi:hypothetical protein
MPTLIETNDDGDEIARWDIDDPSLTKARLIALFKLSYRFPERFTLDDSEDKPHPSDGIAPKDHKDCMDLILDCQGQIAELGYQPDKGDYQRIANRLIAVFQGKYGVKPRLIIRELANRPGVYGARKKGYPPSFWKIARVEIIALMQERKAEWGTQGKRKKLGTDLSKLRDLDI